LIELFVDGKEDGLPDAGRLDELGLGSGSVVFMLHRPGWRWETSGMALSEDGLAATKNGTAWQLVTGGSLMTRMTEGRHYWEVEITSGGNKPIMLGAVRPGLDHDDRYITMAGYDAYFINGYTYSSTRGPQGKTATRAKTTPTGRCQVPLPPPPTTRLCHWCRLGQPGELRRAAIPIPNTRSSCEQRRQRAQGTRNTALHIRLSDCQLPTSTYHRLLHVAWYYW
jgi:hypothetical protein